MIKRAVYGAEARSKVLEGVRKIAAAVKVTLGPLGRNVLISEGHWTDTGVAYLPVHITKDGYTTTKGFDVEDPFEKIGVKMVKEAAQKTVDQAGDGTTTTVVLMEAIVAAGTELINNGYNPIQLKKEIDDAVSMIVREFQRMSEQIDSNERIYNIATISANNDQEIGRIIADAFAKIGKEGIIDLEAGESVNTEIRIADGYRFGRSWVSPLFINNKEKQICEFDNPLILLYEKVVIHHTQVMRACELATKVGRPLVIICEDAKEEGLGFMVMNTYQKRMQACIVKSPNFGDQRRQEMEDIALITGGTYISDSKGIEVKEIEFENLGQAKKIIINKEETIIIGGLSDKEAVEAQLNELRMNLAQAKNEDAAWPIEGRIAKLTGGVAVIQVGGPTESEMKERLDRFDDAVRATKAAIAEGYLPGAGRMFESLSYGLSDEGGQGVIKKALWQPFIQICKNAGVDPLAISLKLDGRPYHYGYNAKTSMITNLTVDGIIDPTKVLRCALQNAASAASMVLTTECLIADIQ
jgi:chaperonin GroEL